MSAKRNKLVRRPAMPTHELRSHLERFKNMSEEDLFGTPPSPAPPSSTPVTSSSGSTSSRPPRPSHSTSSGGTRKYTGLTTSGLTSTPQSPMSTPRNRRHDPSDAERRESARRRREAAARRSNTSATAASSRSHRRPSAFIDASAQVFYGFR